MQLDDVHGRHGEPGAIDHAADIAVESDVVELGALGLDLDRILLGFVAQPGDVGVPEQRVVVEAHLGVEGDQLSVAVTTSGLISIIEQSRSMKAR